MVGLFGQGGGVVGGVVQGGAGGKGGPAPGDILTSVNSQPILDTTALLNSIAQLKPGAEAKVTVSRKGKAVELTIVVGKRPPPTRRNVPMPSQDDEEQQ